MRVSVWSDELSNGSDISARNGKQGGSELCDLAQVQEPLSNVLTRKPTKVRSQSNDVKQGLSEKKNETYLTIQHLPEEEDERSTALQHLSEENDEHSSAFEHMSEEKDDSSLALQRFPSLVEHALKCEKTSLALTEQNPASTSEPNSQYMWS